MTNKIIHAVSALVLFALPIALSNHGGWQQLTLGGILNALYLYLSQKANPTIPLAQARLGGYSGE